MDTTTKNHRRGLLSDSVRNGSDHAAEVSAGIIGKKRLDRIPVRSVERVHHMPRSQVEHDDKSPALIGPKCVRVASSDHEAPALVKHGGQAAQFAYDEFFYGRLRNVHTRKNYRHAVHRFLDWCHRRQLELQQISPKHMGQHLDALPLSISTK